MDINFLTPEIKNLIQKQNAAQSKQGRAVFNHVPKVNLNFTVPNIPSPAITFPSIPAASLLLWLIIFLITAFIAFFGFSIVDAGIQAYKLNQDRTVIQSSLKNKNFKAVYNQSVYAQKRLALLNSDLKSLSRLSFIPVVGPQIQENQKAVQGVYNLLSAGMPALKIAAQTNGNFYELDNKTRSEFIISLADNGTQITQSINELSKNQSVFIPSDLKNDLEQLNEFTQLAPHMPTLLGAEKPVKYLVLFANNMEIRPGGGFIGSYAVITVNAGKIENVEVFNPYELPSYRNPNLGPPAPEVMQRYLQIRSLQFRDANWSPDYPTSVKALTAAYERESGQYAAQIDGMFMVTTEILPKALKLTGPVTVDGVTFTSENAISELQHQVEVAFLEKGIDWYRRKDIVGSLSKVLLNRVNELPFEQKIKFAQSVHELIETKHLVLSFDNPVLQQIALQKNWAGQIKPYQADTLMIIDANLAGHKTEPVMNKIYTYEVSEENGKLYADLYIYYKHRGRTNILVNNYRSFMRVYAPAGSQLLSASGANSAVEQSNELNRTVFGALVYVPVGQERVLHFKYQLPESITEQNYSLQVSKQLGAYPAQLRLKFNFDKVTKEEITDILNEDKLYTP